MKRSEYKATLHIGGDLISEVTGYAWNSTLRKSEALMREYARSQGVIFTGNKPHRVEDTYARTWFSGSRMAVTSVRKA